MKLSALILVTVTLLLATKARSAVIYSGYQNIAVPLDFDGVYLNIVTGATSAGQPVSWNTAPWINPFFGGVYIGNDDLLRPVITGADQIVNLAVGTSVPGTGTFATGESGSTTHVGGGAGQFTIGTPGSIGFQFEATIGGATKFGWLNVTINNAGPGVIHDWAYDDAGGSIVVGRVQQSAPSGGTQIFTLSPGTGESFTLGSAITDTGGNINSLLKTGDGSTTLATANNFTGTTTVSGGTLDAAAAGVLGNTASVTVNTGGTLLLGGTGNRINETAGVDLAGGTLKTAGLSETVGALTLSASSIIDLATGNGTLQFGDSHVPGWTGTLSIYNWTSGSDHVFFGTVDHPWNLTDGGLNTSQLAQIAFYSGAGTGFLGTGQFLAGGFGAVVPVPEPSSVFAGLALFGLAGWRERRKSQARRRESRCAAWRPIV